MWTWRRCRADAEKRGHHLRAEQRRPVAKVGHQAGDERVGLDAEPERDDADIGEDAVEALGQQEDDQDDVAETATAARRSCVLAAARCRQNDGCSAYAVFAMRPAMTQGQRAYHRSGQREGGKGRRSRRGRARLAPACAAAQTSRSLRRRGTRLRGRSRAWRRSSRSASSDTSGWRGISLRARTRAGRSAAGRTAVAVHSGPPVHGRVVHRAQVEVRLSERQFRRARRPERLPRRLRDRRRARAAGRYTRASGVVKPRSGVMPLTMNGTCVASRKKMRRQRQAPRGRASRAAERVRAVARQHGQHQRHDHREPRRHAQPVEARHVLVEQPVRRGDFDRPAERLRQRPQREPRRDEQAGQRKKPRSRRNARAQSRARGDDQQQERSGNVAAQAAAD